MTQADIDVLFNASLKRSLERANTRREGVRCACGRDCRHGGGFPCPRLPWPWLTDEERGRRIGLLNSVLEHYMRCDSTPISHVQNR